MKLTNPWILLTLIPVFWFFFLYRVKAKGALKYSLEPETLKKLPRPSRLRQLPKIFIFLTVCFWVIALCGPIYGVREEKEVRETHSVRLVLDFSGSMGCSYRRGIGGAGENPEQVVRELSDQFIAARAGDKIGIIAFSGRAFGYIGFIDHARLREDLKGIGTWSRELGGGTEPGEGLFNAFAGFLIEHVQEVVEAKSLPFKERSERMETAWANLKQIKASLYKKEKPLFIPEMPELKERGGLGKGRAAILITDGEFFTGSNIDPVTITKEYFKRFGIRLYMISVSKEPEKVRKAIESTGGKFYFIKSLSDRQNLEKVLAEIDALEKAPFVLRVFSKEKSARNYFIGVGLAFLIAVAVLGLSRKFRIIP